MNKEERILNVVKDCLKRRSGTTIVTITIREDGTTDVKATSEYEGSFCDDAEEAEPSCGKPANKEEKEEKEEEAVAEEVVPSFDVDMDDMDDTEVTLDPDAAVPSLKDLLAN